MPTKTTPPASKTRTIAYWLITGLIALGITGSGIGNLVAPPELVAAYEKLGYPLYVMVLLGVAKLLAAIAMLAPRFPRLKEWAYAGIAFDMIGAFYSHVMVGDPINETIMPLVFLSLAMSSYFLRPADRRLPDAAS